MNADQIAEIRPAVIEAIDGAPDTCVTLEVDGASEQWMQIVDRTINAAYPHRESPEEKLKSVLSVPMVAKVIGWEAGKFATFEFAEMESTTVAHWIDAYFVGVLGCTEGDYHVDMTCERI